MTDSASKQTPGAIDFHKRIRAIHYIASWVAFVALIFCSYQESAHTVAWFFSFCWGLLLTLWCREDAIVHAKPLPRLSMWVVFFFWPIAIPACTLRVYGLLYGVILIVLHAMIYAVASVLPAFFLIAE